MRAIVLPTLLAFAVADLAYAFPPPGEAAAVARCRAAGGDWRAATMLTGTCVMPTSDAGRTCTDDAQCQGLCIPGEDAYLRRSCSADFGTTLCSERRILRAKAGDVLQGVCAATRQDTLPLNCAAHIVDGRLVIEGCAD
jgi:hypothetical protein